jgi:hypothetical protein
MFWTLTYQTFWHRPSLTGGVNSGPLRLSEHVRACRRGSGVMTNPPPPPTSLQRNIEAHYS